jgi:hypothetical protein
MFCGQLLDGACLLCKVFPLPFPLKSFNDKSHLEMLCSSQLLDLMALLIAKVFCSSGSFLLPLLDMAAKFHQVFGQSAALPKLMHQMAIKN